MKPKRRIRAGRLLVLSGTVCAFILIIAGIIGRLVYKPNKNVVILNGVMEYYQHPDYPTGCESVALYILLQYYGVDVTVDKIIDEQEVQEPMYRIRPGMPIFPWGKGL